MIKSTIYILLRVYIRLIHEIRLDKLDDDDFHSRSDEIELSETANPYRKRVFFRAPRVQSSRIVRINFEIRATFTSFFERIWSDW